MSPALIWFIVGIVFILAEFVMPGFVIAFFGFGALVAALTTLIGLTTTIGWQTAVFIVVSILSLVLLRRFVAGVFKGKTEGEGVEEFNVDVGKIVPVTETIDAHKGTGRVKYQGATWKAKSDAVIAQGASARITGKDNITLIVEPVE